MSEISTERMVRCRCFIPPNDRCPVEVPIDQPFCDDCQRHAEEGLTDHCDIETAIPPGLP